MKCKCEHEREKHQWKTKLGRCKHSEWDDKQELYVRCQCKHFESEWEEGYHDGLEDAIRTLEGALIKLKTTHNQDNKKSESGGE